MQLLGHLLDLRFVQLSYNCPQIGFPGYSHESQLSPACLSFLWL